MVVSTPDHTHAPACVWAMNRGLSVYCEKPLCHDIYEARKLRELAKAKNVATQMGTQMHASENYRRAVELVTSGVIGPVREVHVWCGKDRSATPRSDQPRPAPADLDWDLWLGPAPLRPYDPCYVPIHWRWWWEFGNGLLGDMGCHILDCDIALIRMFEVALRQPDEESAHRATAHRPDLTPSRCPSEGQRFGHR